MPPQIENQIKSKIEPEIVESKPRFPKWVKYTLVIVFSIIFLVLITLSTLWAYFTYKSNYSFIYTPSLPIIDQDVVVTTNKFPDWKTYRDEKNKFKVKYPPNSIDTEHSYGLDVFQVKTENRMYNFFIQKNEVGGNDPLNSPSCYKEISKKTFNNSLSYADWSINEELCGENTAISAFSYKNGLVYRILYEVRGGLVKDTDEFYDILSTFEFIIPPPTTK
ncbi:MAG: hypothetical protein WC657_02820 [Candidatus Paceibacterota bacterium]|jgi:hypothetical protein